MGLPGTSPLFLREPEVRRGVALLTAAHGAVMRLADPVLAAAGLGRAHHRILAAVAAAPDQTVSALLRRLGITKQSLGRVLDELVTRGLIEARPGPRDRRQRLLRLTPAGQALEAELFGAVRERVSSAYQAAGADAVAGFWRVLEGLTE